MKLGIDILAKSGVSVLRGKKLGILANSASKASSGVNSVEVLSHGDSGEITALFGPEHGVSLSAQDMEAVSSGKDPNLGVPMHSLYGNTPESLTPTGEMLAEIDTLIVDLQDIGSRYYTYVWTACLSMKACAEFGKELIVCDRPNPIGGLLVEGGKIEDGFESFVGLYSLPARHGMTIGEIVNFVNDRYEIGAALTIMKMEGWQRSMLWPETGLCWHDPSPNMKSFEAGLLYPGMCLIEATNLSEGRGTNEPFLLVGAPFIDGKVLSREFNSLGLPGISAEDVSFTPSRQKWIDEECFGVRWHITDKQTFRPYLTGLAFIWIVNRMYSKKGFKWRADPYEFIADKPAIDLLTGSSAFRESIASAKIEDLINFSQTPKELLTLRSEQLIYT